MSKSRAQVVAEKFPDYISEFLGRPLFCPEDYGFITYEESLEECKRLCCEACWDKPAETEDIRIVTDDEESEGEA